jgi:hypothetical protein
MQEFLAAAVPISEAGSVSFSGRSALTKSRVRIEADLTARIQN